jgi:DNA polymerase I-like protein with 3'-5' exonuclease and polymerase domains
MPGKKRPKVERHCFDEELKSANLPVIARTDKKNKSLGKQPASTSRETLDLLQDHVKTPLQEELLKHYYRLTFLQTERKELKQVVDFTPPEGGLIHPDYNLGGRGQLEEETEPVVTGRWSGARPNPQKFADYVKRHATSRWPKGLLLEADASQIEPRVAYLYSRDEKIKWLFTEPGVDGYLEVCKVVPAFRQKPREFRFLGKRGFLSFMYGAEVPTILEHFNTDLRKMGKKERITETVATEVYEALKKMMPHHFQWIEDTWAFCRKHHYVEALTGRRRHLLEAASRSWVHRHHARNQAINFPIQSVANDINTAAALEIGWASKSLRWFLMTMVHDSAVYDVIGRREAAKLVRKIHRLWADIPSVAKKWLDIDVDIEMKVTTKVGRFWHPMTKVGPDWDGDTACLSKTRG